MTSPPEPEAEPAWKADFRAHRAEVATQWMRILTLSGVSIGVLAIDLATKILAVTHLEWQPPRPILGGLIYLQVIRNPGAAFGMVTGWAHGTKSVLHLTRHDGIGGRNRGPCRAQSGLPSEGIQGGVAVNVDQLRPTRLDVIQELVGHAAQGGDIKTVVRQLQFRNGGQRRFASVQHIGHAGDQQTVFDRIKPGRALGVVRAHLVFPAIFVGVISCFAHGGALACLTSSVQLTMST